MKVRPAYTLLPLTVPSVISRCLLSLPSSPHLVSAAQTSQIIGIRLLSFNIPAVNSALCILTRRHSHRTWWWWHLVGFLLQRFHWKWHIFHLNVKNIFFFLYNPTISFYFFCPMYVVDVIHSTAHSSALYNWSTGGCNEPRTTERQVK